MKHRTITYTLAALVAVGSVPAIAQQPSQPAGSQQPAPSSPPAQQSPMPSPATQSPSAPSASTTGHGVEIASDSILGTTVRDAQGKDIGSVSKLMIDPAQGKVMSVIIKRGGTLGIGGKELAVPWSAVQIKRDQNQNMVVTLQQPLLEEAPARQDGRKDNGRDRSPSASPKSDDDKRNDKK